MPIINNIFYLFDDDFAVVSMCTNRCSSEVVIPSEIFGIPVTQICREAFANCSSLKSITLPKNITEISECAFSCCNSLEYITLPNNVLKINNRAFWACSNLKSIHLPDNIIEIGNEAFQYCNSLNSVELPSSVTYIGNNAFYDTIEVTRKSTDIDLTDEIEFGRK